MTELMSSTDANAAGFSDEEIKSLSFGKSEEQETIPIHPMEIAVVICILAIACVVGWMLW